MGADQSKLNIKIPKEIRCFPTYFDEKHLFETVKRIEDCHSHAIQFAKCINNFVLAAPIHPIGQMAFSGATMLFTFLIHRLSNSSLGGVVGLDTADKSDATAGNNNNDPTLEEALIDSKVSAAIAKKSVCEMQAKLCVINNRYHRLLSDISLEDRRLEVVPAIQTCEEVLQLFHDPNHVFRMNPIVSSPFLAPFAGIFVAVAELSLVLIPSYKGPLIAEMALLRDTLTGYKTECIKARMDSIGFRSLQPESMLNVVANGMPERNYRLEDDYLEKTRSKMPKGKATDDISPEDMDKIYHNANEAKVAYKRNLQEEYEKFFGPSLEAISKFSGFQLDED